MVESFLLERSKRRFPVDERRAGTALSGVRRFLDPEPAVDEMRRGAG